VGSEEAQVKTAVDELLEFHLAFCYRAYQICAKKNHDYAGAEGMSPWRNFETCEQLGLARTEAGFLIRMGDKLNRLVTFVRDGRLAVDNEGAMDALLDIINYSILLAAYMQKREVTDGE
jgi:hypothetical protein